MQCLIFQKPKLKSGPLQPDQLTGKIEFRNVSFIYPSRPGEEVIKNLRSAIFLLVSQKYFKKTLPILSTICIFPQQIAYILVQIRVSIQTIYSEE